MWAVFVNVLLSSTKIQFPGLKPPEHCQETAMQGKSVLQVRKEEKGSQCKACEEAWVPHTPQHMTSTLNEDTIAKLNR